MTKFFNTLFRIMKIILLLLSFVLTLYILLNMYVSLGKEPFGKDFPEFIMIILPFSLLLIFFVINFVCHQKYVNNNIFYNATCVVCLLAIVYMCYRTVFDSNMILWHKIAVHINFDYFADQLFQIKTMLYGMLIINILCIVEGRINRKKELNIME